MDHDLKRLWPAAEPPSGFAERVVERTLADPPRMLVSVPRTSRSALQRLGRPMATVLALAASMALIVAVWSLRTRDHGEAFAAEPREIAIGERASALLQSGSHIAWSGTVVRQDRGFVEYRVQPGGPFVVQTPFGSVHVVGTIFDVRVGATPTEDESMKAKEWAMGTAGATLAALLVVNVHEGKVQLANGDRQLSLSRGETGAIGPNGIPERADPLLATADSSRALPAGPPDSKATRQLTPEQQQLRNRVLGAVRKQKTEKPAPPAMPSPSAGTPDNRDGTMVDKTGLMGDEVKIINHELMPMIRQCFNDARERKPHLHGMLALQVRLTSAEGVGSIFESVEPSSRNEVADDELIDCVRQSAFSIDLPPPKADRSNEGEMTIPLDSDAGTR